MLSKYLGPSTLVTAAFIGPGTITVCTIAGVESEFSLLWAIVFSVIKALILQEMSARLGLVTQNGFGEAIRKEMKAPLFRWMAIILVFGAIIIGNAAYEGGNISGAVLGFEELFLNLKFEFNQTFIPITPLLIGMLAFILLFIGQIKLIEWFLIGLVLVMSLVFVSTAIVVQPNIVQIIKGLTIPW